MAIDFRESLLKLSKNVKKTLLVSKYSEIQNLLTSESFTEKHLHLILTAIHTGYFLNEVELSEELKKKIFKFLKNSKELPENEKYGSEGNFFSEKLFILFFDGGNKEEIRSLNSKFSKNDIDGRILKRSISSNGQNIVPLLDLSENEGKNKNEKSDNKFYALKEYCRSLTSEEYNKLDRRVRIALIKYLKFNELDSSFQKEIFRLFKKEDAVMLLYNDLEIKDLSVKVKKNGANLKYLTVEQTLKLSLKSGDTLTAKSIVPPSNEEKIFDVPPVNGYFSRKDRIGEDELDFKESYQLNVESYRNSSVYKKLIDNKTITPNKYIKLYKGLKIATYSLVTILAVIGILGITYLVLKYKFDFFSDSKGNISEPYKTFKTMGEWISNLIQ